MGPRHKAFAKLHEIVVNVEQDEMPTPQSASVFTRERMGQVTPSFGNLQVCSSTAPPGCTGISIADVKEMESPALVPKIGKRLIFTGKMFSPQGLKSLEDPLETRAVKEFRSISEQNWLESCLGMRMR